MKMAKNEKNPETARILEAQKCLDTPGGKILYQMLMKFTRADSAVIPIDANRRIDPLMVMRNEGRRSVLVYIAELKNKSLNLIKQKKAEL